MVRTLEIYRKTKMQNVYGEELWLLSFRELPHDDLEALFDDEPYVCCRGRIQLGSLKLISSSQELLVKQ